MAHHMPSNTWSTPFSVSRLTVWLEPWTLCLLFYMDLRTRILWLLKRKDQIESKQERLVISEDCVSSRGFLLWCS